MCLSVICSSGGPPDQFFKYSETASLKSLAQTTSAENSIRSPKRSITYFRRRIFFKNQCYYAGTLRIGVEEVWKDIPGYEGLYQASSLGNIKSLRRGKNLKPGYNKKVGTYGVSLCNGKQKKYNVHTLIALTFIGPRPEGMVICHGSRGRHDNSVSNLSYGTQKKNTSKDYERDNPGKHHVACKLNKPQVRVIKHILRSKKFQHKEIGEIFSVSAAAIDMIAYGYTWKTV